MILRDLSDPRLEIVTITEVEVTADLKLARVFFSARGDRVREEAALQGLEGAAGFIRKEFWPGTAAAVYAGADVSSRSFLRIWKQN